MGHKGSFNPVKMTPLDLDSTHGIARRKNRVYLFTASLQARVHTHTHFDAPSLSLLPPCNIHSTLYTLHTAHCTHNFPTTQPELKVVVINLRVAAQIRGMFAGDSSTESGD